MRHEFPFFASPQQRPFSVSVGRKAGSVILSGLVILLLSFLTFVQTALAQTATQHHPSLLVLGDSLSAGYGITMEKSWVSLLQQKFLKSANADWQNIQVINASISGETTSGGKSRLPALMQKHHPHWLIIELGANDALRGQNLRASQKNMVDMIALAQQQGAKVMLLGIRLPTNYGPAYDKRLQKMYADLAKQYDLIFDPFFLEDVALDPDLMQADGLHPNEAAQPMILERLWTHIKILLNSPS